jgi:hypothetical protein
MGAEQAIAEAVNAAIVNSWPIRIMTLLQMAADRGRIVSREGAIVTTA